MKRGDSGKNSSILFLYYKVYFSLCLYASLYTCSSVRAEITIILMVVSVFSSW